MAVALGERVGYGRGMQWVALMQNNGGVYDA